VYEEGDEFDEVRIIQKRLDDLGYLTFEPTGYFGAQTKKALEEFQTNNDMEKRDGIADEETLKKLCLSDPIERAEPARKTNEGAEG